MERYSVIEDKNPREIVLLRGKGCSYKRCKFCDYHFDFSKDEQANYLLNKEVLDKVTGKYHHLEVINSGSFVDLDQNTISYIKDICLLKKINILHFECHYLFRKQINDFKKYFNDYGIIVKIKIGVETFNYRDRERYLDKGIKEENPEVIAKEFDECCLLFGLDFQNKESMLKDVETGLAYFERVCINIMVENTTNIKPNKDVIKTFINDIYPLYKDNERVDILLNNTDFGVGD